MKVDKRLAKTLYVLRGEKETHSNKGHQGHNGRMILCIREGNKAGSGDQELALFLSRKDEGAKEKSSSNVLLCCTHKESSDVKQCTHYGYCFGYMRSRSALSIKKTEAFLFLEIIRTSSITRRVLLEHLY